MRKRGMSFFPLCLFYFNEFSVFSVAKNPFVYNLSISDCKDAGLFATEGTEKHGEENEKKRDSFLTPIPLLF